MPIVYVKDRSNNIIHIEESFSSLIWTERYQDDGEFEIDLPLKIANREAYQKGNYVIMDDSDFTMLIETIENTDDDSTLKVSGRTLSCILDRRVTASKVITLRSGPVKYSGDYGSVVSKIVKDDITESYVEYYDYEHYNEDTGRWEEGYGPGTNTRNRLVRKTRSAPERVIPNFVYENEVTGVTIDKSIDKVTSIHDIIVKFSKAYITGFRIDLDSYGKFIFKTYKGHDRTGIEKEYRPVFFGPSMDNVIYVNSFDDETDYKNVVLVVQDKDEEGTEENPLPDKDPAYGFYDRSLTDASDISGLDRREVCVEGETPTESTTTDPTDEPPEETLSVEEARIAAAEKAFDSEDYDRIKTTEGAIDPLVQYKLGIDYNIGDLVRIESWTGEYSISLIDEVVRSYDDSGYTVTPNFKSMDDYDYGEEDK